MDKARIIKEYRELNNLTQKQVAEKLDITHSAYSKYERKDRGITDELWFKLCAILGIPRNFSKRTKEDYENIYLENYNLELRFLSERIKSKYKYDSIEDKSKAKQIFNDYVMRIEDDKESIIDVLQKKSIEEYVIDYNLKKYFD